MKINNSQELKAAILALEDRKQKEQDELVQNFHSFKESLSPINLIKSTFNKVKGTPGITGNVIKATLGMGAGILSKKILVGSSPGIFKKMIGSLVEMGVAGIVSKNSDGIQSTGNRFLKKILGPKKKKIVM